MKTASIPPLPPDSMLISELPEFVHVKGFAVDINGNVFSCRVPGVFRGFYRSEWLKHKVRKDSKGYVRLALTINGIRKDYRVHIIVAKLFIPRIEGKYFVNHKDGIRTHNHKDNLEWCTHAENVQHSYDFLSRPRLHGEKSPKSKLTNEDVEEIWYYLNHKIPMRIIANTYDVHHSIIDGIKQGKRWKHLKPAA